MRREGFRLRPQLAPGDPGLRRIARLMAPATFGLAATQINILVDTILASWYEGAITWLQLAFRLMQLPLGLFGVAIGSANLARVSRDAARGDQEGLRSNLATALRAGGLLALPAAAGLIALREPIVRLLFEHGEFSAEDTAKTAAAVLCYAVGLFAYTLTKTQVPTFYALGETRTPVIASATAVSFKIVANFLFIALLPRLGLDAFLGLALSTSLAAWLNFLLLGRALRGRVGSLARYAVVSTCLKMALLSILMGTAGVLLHRALESWLGGGAFVGEAARLAAAIVFSVAVLAVGVWALGLPEARALLERAGAARPSGGEKDGSS
jgi:putative peptidoglycan lipid II flippase